MRLLLDTHIALWAITNDSKLTPAAKVLIEDPANQIAVSAASIWEIAIKNQLNREHMPVSGSEALHWFRVSGYNIVEISGEHAAAVGLLPPIHHDPFDRLILAQAFHDPYRLVTRDKTVARYDGSIILVD